MIIVSGVPDFRAFTIKEKTDLAAVIFGFAGKLEYPETKHATG